MPAKLYTGEDAQDVAAYVASAVAKPGEDKGALAAVGVKKSDEVAKAESGKLEIPADPSGGLAYSFGSAEAPAGALEIDSPNESSVDHNIARRGQRRQRDRPGRQERRRLEGQRRRQGRRVHVLLLRPRPSPGRHGGQAHRQVSAAPRRASALRSSASYWSPARWKKNASANTISRMSSTTIIPPASCWSWIGLSPSARSPLP